MSRLSFQVTRRRAFKEFVAMLRDNVVDGLGRSTRAMSQVGGERVRGRPVLVRRKPQRPIALELDGEEGIGQAVDVDLYAAPQRSGHVSSGGLKAGGSRRVCQAWPAMLALWETRGVEENMGCLYIYTLSVRCGRLSSRKDALFSSFSTVSPLASALFETYLRAHRLLANHQHSPRASGLCISTTSKSSDSS